MSEHEWKSLMQQWSNDILASDYRRKFPQGLIDSGWLGFPPATEEEIQEAEARLQTELPASYREFLIVTNGWRMTTPFIDRVWGTEEVDWVTVKRKGIIDRQREVIGELGEMDIPDSEYFVYNRAQPYLLRQNDLENALEVGFGSQIDLYLFVPGMPASGAKWDACLEAPKSVESTRYRSFWDLMVAEYEGFLRLKDVR